MAMAETKSYRRLNKDDAVVALRPGSICHHEDLIPGLERREGGKGDTHLRHDSGDDELLTASTNSSLSQALICPGRAT